MTELAKSGYQYSHTNEYERQFVYKKTANDYYYTMFIICKATNDGQYSVNYELVREKNPVNKQTVEQTRIQEEKRQQALEQVQRKALNEILLQKLENKVGKKAVELWMSVRHFYIEDDPVEGWSFSSNKELRQYLDVDEMIAEFFQIPDTGLPHERLVDFIDSILQLGKLDKNGVFLFVDKNQNNLSNAMGSTVTSNRSSVQGNFSQMSNNQSFSLAGRSLSELPRPTVSIQEEGNIVVDITVNTDGNVISAAIGKGTTINDVRVRESALEAAKKAKFNSISGTVNQSGTITYRYSLR